MSDRRPRSKSPNSSRDNSRNRSRSANSRTPSPQISRRQHGSGGGGGGGRSYENGRRYDNYRGGRGRDNRNDNIDDPDYGYRIHIGDIVKKTSQDQLEDKFSKFGRVKEVFLANTFPQFAIISFEDKLDAEDAIREMDGNLYNGSKIAVSLARPRGRRGGGGGGDRLPPNRSSCYKCGEIGHFAKDCNNEGGSHRDNRDRDRDRYSSRSSYGGGRGRGGRGGGYSGDRGVKSCYRCGKAGHIARDCDNPGESSRSYSDRSRRGGDYGRSERY